MKPSPATGRRLLNVHAMLPLSHANGPGPRAVVWVQGCGLKCPGCCNPLTHSHKPRLLLDPGELAGHILASPGIEGLTVSGGEPFEQALAVGDLCRLVRQNGLSVLAFTGWLYEHIRASRDRAVRALLAQIDILVDGPFIQELADPRLLWRGSRNQRVLLLTDRYGPQALAKEAGPQVEAEFAAGGSLGMTGFPETQDLALLIQRLRRDAGILVQPSPVHARRALRNMLNRPR